MMKLAPLLLLAACAAQEPARTGFDVVCGAIRDDDAAAVLVAFADAEDALGLVLSKRFDVPVVETQGISAAAAVLGPAPRVAYNRREASRILRTHGHDALVWLFAHELGHLVDYAQGIRFEDPWDAELSADFWGGCALGIRLGETEGTMWFLSLMVGDVEHPDSDVRSEAVRKGYGKCAQGWVEL